MLFIPTVSSFSPMSSAAESSDNRHWGCVELGGTTIKVALAKGVATNVIDQQSFDTGDKPGEAIQKAVKYFDGKNISALGIGSFGPVDLNTNSATYGFITSTPKQGWQDFDVVSPFKSLNVPVGFSTDVNTAAFGEMKYGEHGSDVRNACYVTVGTGIGAGVVTDGQLLTGILHPEAGHIPVRRHPKDTFKGVCPFHHDCLEGLATANSIAARYNISIKDLKGLPDDHEAWELESYYLAQLCTSLAMIVSPHVIILGGGVLKRQSLFPRIRAEFVKLVNGYLRVPKMTSDNYIVPSRFDAASSNTSAGCVGTLAWAEQTFADAQKNKK